mgnify:CR=1 FL=1
MSQIRIIAGKLKGRKITFNSNFAIRPSTNRSKETLFNWLMLDIEGSRCLDLFAGSGSLGIEALSRGAEFVVFCEKSKKVASSLKENIINLDCEENSKVLNIDPINSKECLVEGPFDIVFIDPPYRKNLITTSLKLIEKQGLIKTDTLVYIEHERNMDQIDNFDEWYKIKYKIEGEKEYSLLKKNV